MREDIRESLHHWFRMRKKVREFIRNNIRLYDYDNDL